MSPSTGRKVLLLTGAAGQLGTAIIDLVGGRLDVIAIVHRNSLPSWDVEAAQFDAVSGKHEDRSVKRIVCDLTSQAHTTDVVSAIANLTPTIDFVINAAGDGRFLGPTTDAFVLAEDARRQLDLHVIAPALICSVLFHQKWKNIPVASQHASILHISSLAGAKVFKGSGQGFYAASKAATNMLTMHMAHEYGQYGIKVNALAPNSFPSVVSTNTVATHALRILSGNTTGQVFQVG